MRTLFRVVSVAVVARCRASHAAVGALVVSVIASTAGAQFVQQGPKLVGTGTVDGYTSQGPVAVSADGNTAIIGGPLDDIVGTSNVGAVWVFTRAGATWTQQGGKLVGTGAVYPANQGWSVALSADGNTAIVGGPRDDELGADHAGAVWIYTRSGGVWTQQGAKLVGTGAAGRASQGWSVALSGDGNTALVGGPADNGYAGAVWVYTRSGGVWTQQGAKLVGAGAVGNAGQGTSVALSADGNTAIVGGIEDDVHGAAWVFTRSGGVWTQQGPKLVGAGALTFAEQGASVALSADGNTAVVGGHHDNGFLGAAWVFTRSGGVWAQQGPKLVGTGAVGPQSFQGSSVAISGDGNTVLVGGYWDDGGKGATWVFTRVGWSWSQQGTKLIGAGFVCGHENQGRWIALSADGHTALIGSPCNPSDGGAYVFASAVTADDRNADDDCERLPDDFGDAPEGITAYSSGVVGHFPTCRSPSAAGTQEAACRPISTTPGQTGYVWNARPLTIIAPVRPYWLGCSTDGSALGTDPEANGLVNTTGPEGESACDPGLAVDGAESVFGIHFGQDESYGGTDAGLSSPISFQECALNVFPLRAYTCQEGRQAYLNILVDMNADGDWNDNMICGDFCAYEWAVKNALVTLKSGCNTFLSPQFRVGPTPGMGWMRLTLSSEPAGDDFPWAGSAFLSFANTPAGALPLGETEDYPITIHGLAGVDESAVRTVGLGTVVPNPARSSILIHYSLPRDLDVRLDVIDLLGRRVATIEDGMRSPGAHQVGWNLRMSSAQPAPAGFYIVRLRAGNVLLTRQVILIR